MRITVVHAAKIGLLGLTLLSISGCGIIRHNVTADGFLKKINKIHSKPKSGLNIMYYAGTDDQHHHFTYVWGMVFSRKKFKVEKRFLDIESEFEYSKNAFAVSVDSIDDVWHASRKSSGVWERDEGGITVHIRVSPDSSRETPTRIVVSFSKSVLSVGNNRIGFERKILKIIQLDHGVAVLLDSEGMFESDGIQTPNYNISFISNDGQHIWKSEMKTWPNGFLPYENIWAISGRLYAAFLGGSYDIELDAMTGKILNGVDD